MLGRQASSLLFWNRRAVMSSQRGLDTSELGGGESWGGLTGPVDQAVSSPLSEVARRARGCGSRVGEAAIF